MSRKEDRRKAKINDDGVADEKTGPMARWRPDDYLIEMDRMFRDFERRMQNAFSPVADFIGTVPRPRWSLELPDIRRPYADLVDNGNEYKVVVEVPGLQKDQLDITVTPNSLTIRGEARANIQDVGEKKGGFVRRERTYTKIQRNLMFPEEVLSDKAEATLNNGLLEITVPKKEPTEPQSHKVEVK